MRFFMARIFQSTVLSTGLAIFSMLFGAGNLMYPLQVGMNSGNKIAWGLVCFIITAVILPGIGFVGMILFNGDYKAFFYRLGKPIGSLCIFLCMLLIGPMIAIPRITTLSHTMIAPFLGNTILATITPFSSCLFACLFLGVTFLLAYRENRIMSILGTVISPLLLLSLAIIITKGLLCHGDIPLVETSISQLCKIHFMLGYETLDLLGALFFSSILLNMITLEQDPSVKNNPRQLALISFKASFFGVSLLSLVYVGMGLLGMYYGHGLEHVNAGELFSMISFRVLGTCGAIIIGTAVLMACLSTAIALSAVVAEYLHVTIFRKQMSYVTSLLLVLFGSLPLSIAGLTTVLKLTGGVITYVGYPILIVLTMVNIAYKLFGFSWIKLPVFITLVIVVLLHPTVQQLICAW